MSDVEGKEVTLRARRVIKLITFRRAGLSANVQLFGYQAKEGVWVIVVAFRLLGFPVAPLEGIVYLNPYKAPTMDLLLRLAKQERFPFAFCSPHLKVMVSQQAPWSVYQRQEVRLLLSHFYHTASAQSPSVQQHDPEFERARREFERVYAGGNLLIPGLVDKPRLISPSQGVVLE